MRYGGGVLPQASVVDGFRFHTYSTGQITGELTLYGVKNNEFFRLLNETSFTNVSSINY